MKRRNMIHDVLAILGDQEILLVVAAYTDGIEFKRI